MVTISIVLMTNEVEGLLTCVAFIMIILTSIW